MEGLYLLQVLLLSEQSIILVLALAAALFLFLLIASRLSRLEATVLQWTVRAEEQLREARTGPEPGEAPGQSDGETTDHEATRSERMQSLAEMAALRHAVESMREDLKVLADNVTSSRDGVAGRSAATPGPTAPSIRERLASDGYEQVTILGDAVPGGTGAENESRLGVSAMRGGVTYKGQAVIRDGEVVEIVLRPCYGAFP